MWRAFFFAVGTMLIILGLECLVTDHFVVSQGRVSKVLAKILDDKPSNSNETMFAGGGSANGQMPFSPIGAGLNNGFGPNAGLPFRGNPPAQMSKYGPSRFNDNFSDGRQDFYGGMPSAGGAQNSPFSLAGFGSPNESLAVPPIQQLQTRQTMVPQMQQKTQLLTPKDWMPWSLLAAGSLVVLYTNSTSRRSYSE